MQGATRYHLHIDLGNTNTSHTQLILNTGENKRVLEVGPATGYVTEVLQSRGCRVTCIEFDPEAAAVASTFSERMIVGDVETLDLDELLRGEEFDVIMFGDVLEHMVHPDRVLQRVRSHLAPGGYVLASIPNVAHGSIRLALLSGVFRYTELGLLDRTHVRFFTRDSVESMFQWCAYEPEIVGRTTVELFKSEQELAEAEYPPVLIDGILSEPEATTYQFIVKAQPSERSFAQAPPKGPDTTKAPPWLKGFATYEREAKENETALTLARRELTAKTERLRKTENDLVDAQTQLAALRGSTGVRLLQGYRKVTRTLFPPASVRGIPYRLVMRTLRAMLRAVGSLARLLGRGQRARSRHGTIGVLGRSLEHLRHVKALDPIKYALSVEWDEVPRGPAPRGSRPDGEPPTINWLVPTVNEGGGLRTIFRFVEHLQKRGVRQRLYEMPISRVRSSDNDLREQVRKLFGVTIEEASLDFEHMAEADVTIATSWHTAYPVLKQEGIGQKFYFVQDFEPYFAAMGTEAVLADNTYRFGFRGLTAGRWLETKLTSDYGMQCDHFELAVDPLVYYSKDYPTRNKVFYYARPATPRRGFELGMQTLEIFHARHPEYEIVLAGGEIHTKDWKFPLTTKGYLSEEQLNDLYNQCAAALVISLTNCSLLPLEIMAAGCPVVTNAGANNELVLPPDSAILAMPSPRHLADALEQALGITDRSRLVEVAQGYSWEAQFEKVEALLLEAIGAKNPA